MGSAKDVAIDNSIASNKLSIQIIKDKIEVKYKETALLAASSIKIHKAKKMESNAKFICRRMFHSHPEIGWKVDVRKWYDAADVEREATFYIGMKPTQLLIFKLGSGMLFKLYSLSEESTELKKDEGIVYEVQDLQRKIAD